MSTFGITLIANAGGTVESFEVEHKSEFEQLISTEGYAGGTHIYDGMFSFSASGKGENPYELGVVSTIPMTSEKVIITSTTNNTKNDDFIGWSMSGTAYEFAS
jgi:hypothetical protein